MPKHGTASSSEVRPGLGEFLATGAKALYFASSELSQVELDRWARNSEGMQEAILCAFTAQSKPAAPVPAVESKPTEPQAPILPPNGVEFELTLDSATEGLAFVSTFGYDPVNWQFTGKPVEGILTRRFKLVVVGACRNLNDVVRKCGQHGRVPEGSWLQALRLAFPQNDGKGSIGVADSSWVDPDDDVRFPLLNQLGDGWHPDFHWAILGRNSDWRWLVESK